MTNKEYRKCIHCGEYGNGNITVRIRSSIVRWTCPNCDETYTIRS